MATSGTPATPVTGATLGAYPMEMGMMPGALGNLDRVPPQVNATNQSALANNGTVNQEVTNTNTYNNNYFNLYGMQASPWGSMPSYSYANSGMMSPLGAGFGGSMLDPILGGSFFGTNQGGVLGWFQRLFRGY